MLQLQGHMEKQLNYLKIEKTIFIYINISSNEGSGIEYTRKRSNIKGRNREYMKEKWFYASSCIA